jgi:uncharacterized protein
MALKIIFRQNRFFFLILAENRFMKIIGRKQQIKQLQEIMASEQPAFVALYGRLRVGKTFLIKELLQDSFTFYTTGLANAKTKAQLDFFTQNLNKTFQTNHAVPRNWLTAFNLLSIELGKIDGPKLLFIDELPWLDTKKSDFMTGLESFWNGWASSQTGLKLIVCGSAASWMINELIRNKGGLYNRVTHRMKIEAFTLAETEEYLISKGINYDKYQLVTLYMAIGGIPFYLEQVKRGLSGHQNIEHICFDETGVLHDEFTLLFASLFSHGDKHELILRKIFALGSRATRDNLVTKSDVSSSGELTKRLSELEHSGFIKSYTPLGGTKNKKIYFISDYYSLFYLKFIESAPDYEAGYWLNQINDPAVRVWQGLAFEQVCWDHIQCIKAALGISGVYTEVSTWFSQGTESRNGAQIDLVLDRKDRVIHLFEIKFSVGPFAINKAYDLNLRNKLATFIEQTQTKKSVFLSFISTYGLVPNEYAQSIVQNELTIEDLFR